jgi:hypothetical protein
MKATILRNGDGFEDYRKLGYFPSHPGGGATSRTLEVSYDCWCVARMADALGHHDDAVDFYRMAADYCNVFDRTTAFMRGRKADGSWRRPFDPVGLINDEYTEADSWQYAFAVQQDLPGAIRLYGGDTAFARKLDALFSADSTIRTNIPDITGLIGQYSQGDEQCHHVAYLYDYAGEPYKTQMHARQVMAEEYGDTPDGECGNVDCGQMAAWYVFSAMGFYPVNPASGVYAIGSPVLGKTVLHLDAKRYGGRTFTVIARNNGPKNVYIQSATWNGKPYQRAWITREQITSGGTLVLAMGSKPNTAWGAAPAVRPPATMPAGFRYPAVPAPADDRTVMLPLPIRVACGTEDPVGDFVPDPNLVGGGTNSTGDHVAADVPDAAPEGVYQSERYGDDFTYHFPVPKDKNYTVRLHFAETFDSGAGERIENVAVNGATVLPHFDILTAAGGTNKAIVKSFAGIRPDLAGEITVRVSAASDSPDQHAKINGIEILPE